MPCSPTTPQNFRRLSTLRQRRSTRSTRSRKRSRLSSTRLLLPRAVGGEGFTARTSDLLPLQIAPPPVLEAGSIFSARASFAIVIPRKRRSWILRDGFQLPAATRALIFPFTLTRTPSLFQRRRERLGLGA